MTASKVFRSYSPAFRYPLVIGKVNGMQLPFRFTVQQAGAFLFSIIFGFKTRNAWEVVLPLSGIWVLLAVGGFSVWLAWLVQYKLIEGRHPLAFAIGWIKYFLLAKKLNTSTEPTYEAAYKFKILKPPVTKSETKECAQTVSKPASFSHIEHELSGWEVFSDA